MKKLLNTLFIINENTYLSLEGETICLKVKGEKVAQVPLHTLESIYCFSFKGASPSLMGKCAEKGIPLVLFQPSGKFLCRIIGESKGNILLRKEQYRISDNENTSCSIAKNMIIGKIYNSKWCIHRIMRDHSLRIDEKEFHKSISLLNQILEKVRTAKDLDVLRGYEGEAASIYFGVFNDMILNQKENFVFRERNRRPPLDNVNAMLSFVYTLLGNDCANALEGAGLDSYAGFLHRDRPGRKSLALDLMEELRPVVADRFVLTLINKRQINNSFFIKTESGAVEFSEEGRRKILSLWQERKQAEIKHPFLKEKIYWGLVPHAQALLLARFIRGDIDGYPPFLWK